jgi:hypothetical protein
MLSLLTDEVCLTNLKYFAYIFFYHLSLSRTTITGENLCTLRNLGPLMIFFLLDPPHCSSQQWNWFKMLLSKCISQIEPRLMSLLRVWEILMFKCHRVTSLSESVTDYVRIYFCALRLLKPLTNQFTAWTERTNSRTSNKKYLLLFSVL